MKEVDKQVMKEAIAYEESKRWHIAFSDKEPKTGRKFKCTTLFVHYKILAKTVIRKSKLVQEIEPGLYLISNPFELFHLCITPKVYRRVHTSIGFIHEIPKTETEPYISVLTIKENKPHEILHVMDKISSVKILDRDLYYATTLAGKAYFLFIRDEK